jgi:transcriptional regulator with XRE-family HTH domain
MSIVQSSATGSEHSHEASVLPSNGQPLQRLGAVRRLQGISRRTLARRLNVEIDQVRQQECDTADLPLSTLYAWQKALEVPVAELLVEADESLVPPVLQRSQLLRVMKTVLAIHEQAKQQSIRRMAQTLRDQLVEIMPELEDVSAWHAVGKRRRLSELGIAAQRRLADDLFVEPSE